MNQRKCNMENQSLRFLYELGGKILSQIHHISLCQRNSRNPREPKILALSLYSKTTDYKTGT